MLLTSPSKFQGPVEKNAGKKTTKAAPNVKGKGATRKKTSGKSIKKNICDSTNTRYKTLFFSIFKGTKDKEQEIEATVAASNRPRSPRQKGKTYCDVVKKTKRKRRREIK